MKRLVAFALLAGCSGDGGSDEPRTVFGGNRPVTIQIPSTYDEATPAPLLIVLHGYSVNGEIQTLYFGADALAEEQGALFLAPDGTTDSNSNRFWNATDYCCDFDGTNVDDVAYIRGLIADVRDDYNVDPNRIYLWGHSNGGFMSYRMACEAPEIAAIVSLAGATYKDETLCDPPGTISVLQIHGTLDESVEYAGNAGLPSAAESVETFGAYNGCTGVLTTSGAPVFELDEDITTGPETRSSAVTGCPTGIAAELWTIQDGDHIPSSDVGWTSAARGLVWSWLAAHPKP